ncbi:diflavin oxidoreductase [Algisphaera agarilytica]|uniref:assimilatory sulfite reductase (NADPH) n=1 Tax=Algisphaera agarilytica TaxID=1385975 RepID=A0A7X0LLT4_9BACT|nr:flavodoxin domain-containing protein [Algisphaera agarilytica]MBB6431249.1 sulfite reductase (NADPH) flavoprotein alpha-component [Algisphaera agarilytica]
MSTATPPQPITLPGEAPFNPEQQKFVEGFLSGLVSVKNAQAAAAQPDAPGAPMTILYGSQSGNSEALAKQLRKKARTQGFGPDVAALDSFDFDEIANIKHLLIICSTFGEGDPPDNAMKFTAKLMADDAPDLAHLEYSVCSMGDRSYTHFCKAGNDIDDRLSELGATRIADRVECDVAYEDDYAGWTESLFASQTLIDAAGDLPVGLEEDEDDGHAVGGWDKNNPYFAPVLHVENLNGEGSSKEVNHVEILLSGSGLEYEVGDALGLWPSNDPILVEEILALTGITGTNRILLKGETCPIRLALQAKLDVVTLTQSTLDALGIEGSVEDVKGLHLIDALRKWEPQVPAQGLADALRPLQPRLYSIASSPKAHPGEVHLTVGAVRYKLEGSDRKGVASTFLADRCGFGGRVGVYVHKAPHFHLTDNDTAPVIMCGPGTGIAPFRAFLEERQARKAAGAEVGESWLFFGDQHEATDFLYREQLAEMQADGTLSKLSLAWSRDGDEKVYVQDLMRKNAAEVFAWFENGGHFYICGDASRMAGDVDKALRDIIAEQGQFDEAGVQAYMDKLVDEHRYQRDVY